MSDDPEYLALVAAVLASPRDDLPRLVLADWLEERGQTDRAVYIRCECEFPVDRPRVCDKTGQPIRYRVIVRPPYSVFTEPLYNARCRCRTCATVRRSYMASRSRILVEWERDLRQAVIRPWLDSNGGDFRRMPFVDYKWCRGFPDEVWGDLFGLSHHLPHVFATCPIKVVRRVVGGETLHRWEIEPPEHGSGWQVYVFVGEDDEWRASGSFETREEAVGVIIDNVQTGGGI